MKTSDLFVKNLRRLRKAKYRSQEEFASEVGLSERGYQKYEQGESSPTPEILDRFARALQCAPVDLIANGGSLNQVNTNVAPKPSQYENLTWQLASRILDHYQSAEPRRQLAALYILSKDRSYLSELANLPEGARFSQVLEKLLRA